MSGRDRIADAAPDQSVRFDEVVRPILQSLCANCHGPTEQKGDFRIDSLNPDLVNGDDAETWHDVLNRINLGEMPPPDAEALNRQQRRVLVGWLTESLRAAAQARRYSDGRVVTRRLTRYEYQNTMRDLLGVDLNYAVELPPEPLSSDGFLNNGATLEMSPIQLEAHLKAARRGLTEAIVSGDRPEVHQLRTEKTTLGRFPVNEVAGHEPANPEFAVNVSKYPRYGAFEIRVRAGAIMHPGDNYPRLRVSLGCQPGIIHVPRKTVGEVDVIAPAEQPQEYVFRGRMEDYPQPGDVAFGNASFDGMIVLIDFLNADGKQLRYPGRMYVQPSPKKKPVRKKPGQKNAEVTRQPAPVPKAPPLPEPKLLDIVVQSVEFEAPVITSWPPLSHRRILFQSERDQSETGYVREVLTRFMTQAYRRPVTESEVSRTLDLFQTIQKSATGFEEAMRETLASVLVSPNFLYIVETRTPDGENDSGRLTDYELATRLSYFLWSSMPDASLAALAGAGRLREPDVLAGEVHRMLDDDRSTEFATRFADQWFDLGALDRVAVNPEFFPDFDVALKQEMRNQTRAFLAEVLASDESCLNLIDSDWTMLNRPLAVHYGMNGPRSGAFERVTLTDRRRGGVLGQSAFLLSNATGEESHPIKRAVWILDRLLDSPPAPPPPDVPDLDSDSPDLAGLSLKEQLSIHRQKEACANCHRGIDPWGIPLENLDAIGLWRDAVPVVQNGKRPQKKQPTAKTRPIDSSSVLPDGSRIQGVDELKAYLVEQRADQFARAVVKRLAGYALGRSIDIGDEESIESLSQRFASNGFRLRPLIVDLVNSEMFQTK